MCLQQELVGLHLLAIFFFLCAFLFDLRDALGKAAPAEHEASSSIWAYIFVQGSLWLLDMARRKVKLIKTLKFQKSLLLLNQLLLSQLNIELFLYLH